MRIALINPNTPGNYRKAKVLTANLGLATIASFLLRSPDYQVRIFDARNPSSTAVDIHQQLMRFNPEVLGVSLLVDESSNWVNELLTLVKETHPSTLIVLGSYFPSLYPEKAFERIPLADYIVVGEGEETMASLMEALGKGENLGNIQGIAYRDSSGQTVLTPRRSLIENLDALPYPTRYLASGDGEDLEVMLEGTRGCKFYCSFCAVRPFYGLSAGPSLRLRSADSIVDEMIGLLDRYPKLKSFRFVDPDFIAPYTEDRALDFIERLEKEGRDVHLMMDTRCSSVVKNMDLLKGLQKVGLKRLYLGVESGSPRLLKKMRKAVNVQENFQAAKLMQEAGLDYSYGFMMITPWSLDEDIELNAALLEKIGRIEFRSLFHELTLVPSTPAYQEIADRGELVWTGSLSYFSYETVSPRIERFRQIGRLLQRHYPTLFGDAAGFIYESIRHRHRYGMEDADEIEKMSDSLFLEIFRDCWEASADNFSKTFGEFVEDCYMRYIGQFCNIVQRLDSSVSSINFPESLPQTVKYIQV